MHHYGDQVIHSGGGAPPAPAPAWTAPVPDPSEPDRSYPPTISNEMPRHLPPSRVPLNFGGDVFLAASAPQPNSPDAQILESTGQPFYADTDHTMGGGGDITKAPNTEDVSFAGQGKLNVGSTDVQSALSGDRTRAPNAENVIFTLTEKALGNQESYAGPVEVGSLAPVAPVNNRDFVDTVQGAVGKPLKRNVT